MMKVWSYVGVGMLVALSTTADAQVSVDQKATQTLSEPLQPSVYSWERGQPPSVLVPALSHVCFLTFVSGKFEGGGERIALYIDTGAAGGPKWVLNGTSAQSELRANATCVRKSKFVTPPSFLAGLRVKVEANHMNGACAPHIVPMPGPAGTNAHFITGMAGKFKGGGESISVNGSSAIEVRGCSGFADGTLVSLTSAGALRPKYRTQSSRTTDVGSATFVLSQANDSGGALSSLFGGAPFKLAPDKKWMVPVDEGICGFVRIRGRFQGYGEYAQIAAVKGPDGRLWWTLDLGNKSNDGTVDVAARCYARDQR